MSAHTRYVQLGTDWIPQYATKSRGMGDLIAKGLHAFGVKQTPGCPCPRRQARWNRAIPFTRPRYYAPAIIRSRPPLRGGALGGDAYFNSPECPHVGGVPTNPNHLFCDDFEDGDWYVTAGDGGFANAANNGWYGEVAGLGRNPAPPAAQCASTGGPGGAVGTDCAATSTLVGGAGGNAAMGIHRFYPNAAAYLEVYLRFYMRLRTGYQSCPSGCNQKFISLIEGDQGGIDYGGIGHDVRIMEASPQVDCSIDGSNGGFPIYKNPFAGPGAGSWCYLNQNPAVTGNPQIVMQDNRWYYVEGHVKLNTYCSSVPTTQGGCRDGVWELWLDDCGVNGLGCTGTPTLRSRYTNVAWRGVTAISGSPTPNALIGSWWQDIWGNPSDIGTIDLDQMVASKAFVGFSGAEPPPPAVVSALPSRRVMRGYALVAG